METVLTKVDQILTASARKWSEKTAVFGADGRSCSYEQLEAAANSVAELLSTSRVSSGSVMGIKLLNADSFLAVLFGVLRAGCVAIPVPLNLSSAEQARVISDSGVSWILEEELHTTRVIAGGVRLWANSSLSLVRVSHARADIVTSIFPEAAVMRHTSGTTGESKGVVLSHHAVLERIAASEQLLGLCSEDIVLTPLSLSYHFVASALSCIRAGAAIIDCFEVPAKTLPSVIQRHPPTLIYAAPEFYEQFYEVGAAEILRSVRSAISTSGPLHKEVATLFEQKFSLRITQVFGIIEVGLPLWNDRSSYEVASLGACRPPYEAMVVNEEGHASALGDVGELLIRGPGMFSGYIFTQQQSAVHSAGNWFATGDLVEQDLLGTIKFKGRKKNIIRRGNNSIFPEEIEAVLQRASEIKNVRVIEEHNHGANSSLVAEVVLHPSALPDENAWRQLCTQELPDYKVPERFKIVASLPQTASGKILRWAC